MLKSDKFRKATPYNEAFYQTMFMVKDFWAVPEYAELLTQMNKRLHPFVVGGKGTAEEALDGLADDWDATFKKYKRSIRSKAARPEGQPSPGPLPIDERHSQERERRAIAESV